MNKEQLISKWKEFCFDLVDARNKNLLETPYQERIENGLRQLGWSKASGVDFSGTLLIPKCYHERLHPLSGEYRIRVVDQY